ncbi:hypothetical protein LSTR_LSTR011706 [Laodelphax striatellus]|uniref:Uncharacterized protein n=1 Tax=Laodelphax striatellus TaxID=195883 RepID=A0A482WUZ9_LAOST|nr:hypothetical protein LSTR_LSTR011706 [Laodelphax striatellus]
MMTVDLHMNQMSMMTLSMKQTDYGSQTEITNDDSEPLHEHSMTLSMKQTEYGTQIEITKNIPYGKMGQFQIWPHLDLDLVIYGLIWSDLGCQIWIHFRSGMPDLDSFQIWPDLAS